MNFVVIDFETASACDLVAAGAWRYAEDPTTEIICLAYGDEERTDLWVPGGDAGSLYDLVLDEQCTFIAHNAAFEKAIWRRIMVEQYSWPDVPNSRWHDTLASCAYRNLPQKLERAASVLRLPAQKDTVGSKLVRTLSKPQKDGSYDRSPDTLQRIYQYCRSDISAELDLHSRVGWLPSGTPGHPGERGVWLLDQRINERGVRLDLDYVDASQRIVDLASAPLLAEFKAMTGVKMTQVAKFKEWIKGQGVEVGSLDKEHMAALLGETEDGETPDIDDGDLLLPKLPDAVRRALSIRQLIGSSSVKKLKRMHECVCSDGRVRGTLQYHGTGPGRWAGRLFQPQNFPRGTLKLGEKAPSPDIVVEAIMTGDPDYVQMLLGPPVEAVVSGLRHSIVAAPGRVLLSGDYAGIQARVVLALSGQHDKAAIMASGADIYCDMAQQIYKRPIDKKKDPAERQTGKNSVLGLGFQMGWRKFKVKYAGHETDEFCENVVRVYRKEWAPCVPKLWYALEDAAVKTVHDKRAHEAFGVTYALEDGWLSARLPSGRKIWYFNPVPTRKAMPWDETDVRRSFTFQAMKTGQWRTIDAFGGLLTENVVMGIERDIMVHGMFNLERNGFPVILNVHDELLTEPETANADMKAMEEIMVDCPAWARDMQVPVAVECWMGGRYRK